MKKLLLAVSGVLAMVMFVGCASPKCNIIMDSGAVIYAKSKVSVKPVKCDTSVAEQKKAAEMIKKGLEAVLENKDFVISDEAPEMVIETRIVKFVPMNRGVYYSVGFGAGRGLIEVEAIIKNAADGKKIATLKHSEKFGESFGLDQRFYASFAYPIANTMKCNAKNK